MPYISLTDLTGLIPGKFLIEALDDNGDGLADPDVVTQVIADASLVVDKTIGGPFPMPFPAKVVNAAKFLAVEQLYKRRGREEANPFKKDADAARQELADIAAGKVLLAPKITPGRPSVTAITHPVATRPAQKTNV